jgi:hypothetical protein
LEGYSEAGDAQDCEGDDGKAEESEENGAEASKSLAGAL